MASDAERGWRDYNALLLAVYDRFVLGFMARVVWRTSTPRLLDNYRRHIRDRHLDVGPGTGWFVEHSGLAAGSDVTLLDPNATVLDHAGRRLGAYRVVTVVANALEPVPVTGPFASAGLNLVLHCMPGPMDRKAAVVRNIAAVLEPDGVLFGSTILGLEGPQTRLSRFVLRLFNRRGAFDNLHDTQDGLRAILEASFDDVVIELSGAAAIFTASARRDPDRNGRRRS